MLPLGPLKEKDSKNNIPESTEGSVKGENWHDLNQDPDFRTLIEYFQNAEFSKCRAIFGKLENRYPGHPELGKIKDDLEMKLSLKGMEAENKKEETKQRRKSTLKLAIFAVVGTLIILAAIFVSVLFQNNEVQNEDLSQGTTQPNSLNKLYEQAEALLLIGQPQSAAEIIEKIRAIDPDYEELSELSNRAETLLELEEKYQNALNLIENDKPAEALVLLKQIEEEHPGMWDVSRRIKLIETSLEIESSLKEGNEAFQNENWDQVILSYENALLLDPEIDDLSIKEQLLRAYLNKIIAMLQNESTSIDDIEKAEQYYRKAIALIPQNRDFSNERINLEEVSRDLLELKYSQIAKEMLADKNQTPSSIAKAVSYLRKAANFDSKNMALQTDLKNSEYYQIAFQNFIDMDWMAAMNNLKSIISVDSNFADGNASILLFESYYFLGKQYYTARIYQDALNYLEQAEIQAWDDTENLFKLFRVQTMIGDTYGKLENYENAVSYYQYALNAIKILTRLNNDYVAIEKYSNANVAVGNQEFERAYTAFQDFFVNTDSIYLIEEVEISSGVCIAFFASENQSLTDAIIEANNLPESMIISFGRILDVPKIEK